MAVEQKTSNLEVDALRERVKELEQAVMAVHDENDRLRGINTYFGGKTEAEREIERLRDRLARAVNWRDYFRAERRRLREQRDAEVFHHTMTQADLREASALAAFERHMRKYGEPGNVRQYTKREWEAYING